MIISPFNDQVLLLNCVFLYTYGKLKNTQVSRMHITFKVIFRGKLRLFSVLVAIFHLEASNDTKKIIDFRSLIR